MRICVGDLEANGLLPEATTIWCGVFIDVNTGERREYGPDQLDDMVEYLKTVDALAFHNGMGYDFPLMDKLLGYKYQGIKVDTLLMSRVQNPNRQRPFSCPNKKAGPHSIEAWGWRVGRGKPNHDDWSRFSPEMMHRCIEDTEILLLVYRELLKEGGPSWASAHELTVDLFEVLQLQEEYGWLMDQDWMTRSLHILEHWMTRIDKILIPKLPNVLVVKEQKVKGEYKYVKKPFLKSGAYSASVLDWFDACDIPSDSRIVSGPYSRILFRTVNLNSNDETKKYLLDEGWVPERWNYKKDPSTKKPMKDRNGQLIRTSPVLNGDDPFHGVSKGIGSLLARRVQCRHRHSQITGWFTVIRPDGRMSQIISGIAATGRLTHKQIVNVPGGDSFFGKWMRKCFTSKEGYVIVGTDSAGCQNRMLAARVGDAAFTKTLVEGKKSDKTSIHFVNQAAIAKVGIDVTYGQSKILNYAFMFGASDNKLGSIIGRNKECGVVLRKALLGVSPGFQALVESLTQEWRGNARVRNNAWGKPEYYNGWITGLDGRPIFIEAEHMILVYMLQSDEAIMMQYALRLLYGWLQDKGWTHGVEYGFVANVHDEYSAEVREDLAEEFADIAEEAIVQAGVILNIKCPHEGEAQIGQTWWEVH